MFAGKTSKLMQHYTENPSVNKIVVDYDVVTRSPDKDNIVCHGIMETHDGISLPNVYKCKELQNIFNSNNYYIFSEDVVEYYHAMVENCEHIYINEAQFFSDLKRFTLNMQEYGKHVHIYGLDADYQQKKFGDIWDLIPYSCYVRKYQGRCRTIMWVRNIYS